MTEKIPDVESAYALKSPDDNRALYARWASTYDSSFAEAMDFLMPSHVARIFHQNAGEGPVLDAGAGTGLVGVALQSHRRLDIDALDISPEMLEMAAAKGIYRRTVVADLTGPLPLADGAYQSVVSCGTFTHGHVGPEALEELLRVAAAGAHFVLTIKTDHFDARGFEQKFADIGTRIAAFEAVDLPIYGATTDPAHVDDRALVVTFTKT